MITTHEAFGYFAIRYDVTIMSPLGISTGSEVSAQRIAELKDVISKGHVQAIFMERNVPVAKLLSHFNRRRNS